MKSNQRSIAFTQTACVIGGAVFITLGLGLSWETGLGIALLSNALSPVVYAE